MTKNLPYVNNPGTLRTMLEKIRDSILPERFNADFVQTKLGMKGGTAKAIIPFIKKMNFVSPEGIPTNLYKEYRNKSKSGFSIATAMKQVYSDIFEQNQYASDLSDRELLGLIVQLTGGDEKSSVTKFTIQTFKVLRDMANFEEEQITEAEVVQEQVRPIQQPQLGQILQYAPNNQNMGNDNEGINLSYTVNLNLPATTNIEVFNAIFKSLKENMLGQ